LDLISSLVDKSLLLEEEDSGEARYRLLEPIRQYASNRLSLAGELAVCQEAQATYYRELAETAKPNLERTGGESWGTRLEVEKDNLRSALAWMVNTGQALAASALPPPCTASGIREGMCSRDVIGLRGFLQCQVLKEHPRTV
jgi:predicted ATPase